MDFKIDDCIFFQLAKASQAGSKFWANCVSKYNLTAVQGMVMNFLGQKDKVTASELGNRTGLDSATITGILDRLEAAGLMERKRHPDDRRAIHVCLTKKGQETAGELYDSSVEANRSFLLSLTSEEASTLKRLLTKIRKI